MSPLLSVIGKLFIDRYAGGKRLRQGVDFLAAQAVMPTKLLRHKNAVGHKLAVQGAIVAVLGLRGIGSTKFGIGPGGHLIELRS